MSLTSQHPQYTVAKSTSSRLDGIAKFAMGKIWIIMLMLAAINLSSVTAMETVKSFQAQYDEFLRTETVIIDTLRDYIEKSEEKISVIKSKIEEINAINAVALNDVDKYVSNPLNALTILKRFATDWNALEKIASSLVNNTDENSKDRNAVTASLKFPSEDDFDEAVGNLLRLQDVYKLEPQRISLGEMNGIKFGPQMSWSDCLEIGRKSDENGDFKIAKFWIETAMGKLPAVNLPSTVSDSNNTDTAATGNDVHNGEIQKARYEILQALLNAEFHMGNFEKALDITNEMLLLKPRHKGVLKAKETIENALKKETKKARNKRLKKTQKREEAPKKAIKKSAEALLIEEICRASTIAPHKATSDANPNKCYLESGNLRVLQLQPIKLEVLSTDPYIAIQHDVLTTKQCDDLKELIEEMSSDSEEYEDEDYVVQLEFTDLAKQKLRRISKKLERNTGHSSYSFGKWKPQRYSFGPGASLTDIDTTATMATTKRQGGVIANLLLNLQTAKLGGSIVFPQLELSLQVPNGALLYWSNLNEFQEVDYRIKHHVCPVISGTQISKLISVFATYEKAIVCGNNDPTGLNVSESLSLLA